MHLKKVYKYAPFSVVQISGKTPKKHDLFLTSSSISRDPCICLIRNHMLGISKDNYLVVVDPDQYSHNKDGNVNSFENVRPGGMENKNSLTPLLWSSPLLDLGSNSKARHGSLF